MGNGVFAESGGPKEMVDGLSLSAEPRFAITQHNSPVRIYPKEVTHVALFWFTVPALLALSGEHREDSVSWFEIRYALTHALNHTNNQKDQIQL